MFKDYIITKIQPDTIDTFILQVKPITTSFVPFIPGQYCKMKNPTYTNPQEEHIFSIASSPTNHHYLEFYIRIYGMWTKTLSKAKVGDTLSIAYPFGKFLFDEKTDRNAVFLVGGVGISPIMSMLRYIYEKVFQGNFILLYGNRTPETIGYKQELGFLAQKIQKLYIVDIFSDLSPTDPWQGYRGFITKEIIEKEINFSLKPTFFIIGPPVFIEKMETILHSFPSGTYSIKKELLS